MSVIVLVIRVHSLTKATLRFIVRLVCTEFEQVLSSVLWLAGGVDVKEGHMTYRAVADAYELPYVPLL